MITGTLKSQVDQIWTSFWSNGRSNPLTIIEQVSYLIFLRALDEVHINRERRARRLGRPFVDPVFGPDQQDLRWSSFRSEGDGRRLHVLMEQRVFPFLKTLGQAAPDGAPSSFARHMADAVFDVPERILVPIVERVDQLPLDDRDTKGDLYEYMLSKLAQAGQNGQFRTPRHIIRMMVELLDPQPTDTICDPACGTAGFLVVAAEVLRERHPAIETTPTLWEHHQQRALHGFDFDPTMLRIAAMNLYLHGIENPHIEARDSLSQDWANVEDAWTVVLANPPFKGSIDYAATASNLLAVARTKKTELLFVAQILRSLKAGGRAAVIVPDGVLFGSSGAHRAIRRALVEEHQLDGIISMPSGVFRPYAGVSTAVLLFTKTGVGGTGNVFFFDMKADGFSLDDKRDPVDTNDIPAVLAAWRQRNPSQLGDRTAQHFYVPKAEIVANDYDLSINRYKQVVHNTVAHEDPRALLARLQALEAEIAAGLKELEGLL